MNYHKSKLKLPAAICAGSLFSLLLLMAFSNPVSHILVALIFFIILFIFMVSAGWSALAYGLVRPKNITVYRLRLLIISLFVVIGMMFVSSKSFTWIDGLMLLLSIGGIVFYTGRRIY